MKKLLKENMVSPEPLWPQCIYTRNYNTLILEDLATLCYDKNSRNTGFDLEQSLLVMRTLGKFHAASLRLVQDSSLDLWTFDICAFLTNTTAKRQFMERKLTLYSNIIEGWGDEWKPLGRQLRKVAPIMLEKLNDLCEKKDSTLNVLNHGDLWRSNIFIKNDEYSNKPISVKFVDFQLAHYNSYGMDIQYFLWTSVDDEVREKNSTALVEAYHSSLLASLIRLGVDPDVLPSVLDVEKEVEKKLLYGVTMALYLADSMQVESENAISLERLLGKGGFSEDMVNSQMVQKKVKAILKPFIHSNLFDV